MNKYILNKNKQDSPSGENYEVHKEGCEYFPLEENQIFLGYFNNCQDAFNTAKVHKPEWKYDIDGCYYCCLACHRE